MIQIKATILRDDNPVFLCGEIVECMVTLTRSMRNTPDMKIGWVSVQIDGYCQMKRNLKTPDLMLPISKTSLNVQAHSMFSTDPQILFCDLKLGPGESKSCEYQGGNFYGLKYCNRVESN
jgi:hypothetical protein